MILISINFFYAQSPTVNRKFYEIDIKSPGIEDFVRYGNISSASYTGSLNYEIPLISNLKGGTPISISLGYDASGFRPSKRPGLVGLNWYLIMGGAITRDVNHIPDDQTGDPSSNGFIKETNGFIVGTRNRTHDKNNVYSFSPNSGMENMNLDFYLLGNNASQAYEGDPDVFNFNFNGISGKFFMGNDGQIKVINNSPGNLKVDISGMQNQPYTLYSSKPIYSLIKITDENGNKYYFGGESKHLEYTTNNKSPVISTWHLYRIEYYTGKVTSFIFRDDNSLSTTFESSEDNSADHAGFPPYNGDQANIRDFCVYSETVNDERYLNSFNGFGSNTGFNTGSGGISLSPVIQKIAILDKIVDENYIINFKYTRQQHIFNTRNGNNDMFPETSFTRMFLDIKLDEIRVNKNNNGSEGDLVNKILFNYVYLGGSIHSRMFLNSVTEYGKRPYIFEYNDTSNLPKPLTFGIDHWGFWNGRSDNYNPLIPKQNYQSNGDFSDCTSTNSDICKTRNPNFNYSIKGILKKVTYPTGGYTDFEYEPHDYSKRIEVKSTNNYFPTLYDVTGVSGGLRIKRIKDFDGTRFTNIKMYEYKTDTNTSSGILLKWPRYTLHWVIPPASAGEQFFGYLRSNPFGFSVQDSPIVTYSQVIEKSTLNGKKVSKFSNYVTNPDENVTEANFRDHSYGATVTPKNLARHYNTFVLNDMSIERGKLVEELYYDQNNNLKTKIEFTYNTDVSRFQKWSARLHLSGPSCEANKIYYYNNFLTRKTVTEYLPSGNIVQVENTSYASTPLYNNSVSEQTVLLKTSKTTSIIGENIETEYKYPWNEYLSTSTEYNNFKNANITVPIRVIQYRNNVKISEQFTKYEKSTSTNNYLLPKEIFSAKFPNSFPLINNVGNLEKKFVYQQYDDKGNVLEYSNENGIPITIIWGYNKSLPIAKIENATNSQVASALGVSNVSTLNESNLATINSLRSNSLFANALITTYVHNPLVGVSLITNPNGYNSSFVYDTYGKLIRVLDNDGKIVEEYQYHLKN